MTVVWALGHLAESFAGPRLWWHLVPFAAAVLGLGLVAALVLRLWLAGRARVVGRLPRLATAVAVVAAGVALYQTQQPPYRRSLVSLRTWLGGRTLVQRETIAHQVYAAYRRTDLDAVARMWLRAEPYAHDVHEAAAACDIDAELLMGVAYVESSFQPRDSADGGRGLFQITAPPVEAVADAKRLLGTAQLDLANARHNAFVAAATLRQYLVQMRGDPFLALLAYNIGPRNGGLRSIMHQYGARDFVTIQPYLQHLPRDYPIRVLSGALAYRLWRTEGRLPRYEDGANALRIQHVGIPGLREDLS